MSLLELAAIGFICWRNSVAGVGKGFNVYLRPPDHNGKTRFVEYLPCPLQRHLLKDGGMDRFPDRMGVDKIMWNGTEFGRRWFCHTDVELAITLPGISGDNLRS